MRHDQPPAVRADPFDEAGNVAVPVASVLHRALLVAEHERPQKHLPQIVAWKYRADLPLRAADLREFLQLTLWADAASKSGISHVVQQTLRLGTELRDPAAIIAVRDLLTAERRVRLEQ